jgi:hypothetical protein
MRSFDIVFHRANTAQPVAYRVMGIPRRRSIVFVPGRTKQQVAVADFSQLVYPQR